MNHKKLLLTLTLCLCALLCMVVTASASEVSVHNNHFSCGVVGCQNNDHGHTQVTEWTAWDGTSEIIYDPETKTAHIYLTQDVTSTIISNLEPAEGCTLYLCLNGKTLKENFRGGIPAIYIGNGSLVLCDCQGGGKVTHGENNCSGVKVVTNGTFTMYGGAISGNVGAFEGGRCFGFGRYLQNVWWFHQWQSMHQHWGCRWRICARRYLRNVWRYHHRQYIYSRCLARRRWCEYRR